MCPSSPSLSGPGSSSRLCKRALYSYFFKVAQQKYLLKLPTYYSVKVGATLITSDKPWLLSLMVSLLTGSSLRLPDSQRAGEATVSEQAWRTLELEEPGGLLQYWMSLQKVSLEYGLMETLVSSLWGLSSDQLHHWRRWSRAFVWTFWLNFCSTSDQIKVFFACGGSSATAANVLFWDFLLVVEFILNKDPVPTCRTFLLVSLLCCSISKVFVGTATMKFD